MDRRYFNVSHLYIDIINNIFLILNDFGTALEISKSIFYKIYENFNFNNDLIPLRYWFKIIDRSLIKI